MSLQKIHLKSVCSTNDYSRENIEKLADKTVVYADLQTAGKGRNSRSWISSLENNLYFSLILKPKYNFKQKTLASLTQYAAVVLTRVFARYGVDARIKWPNDLLVDGKKISGILTETVIKGVELCGVVLGVGVNLNFSQEVLDSIDQPATALNILLGQSVDREEFLDFFLEEFFTKYELILEQGFPLIKNEYIQKSMFLDKKVSIVVFDEIFTGIIKKIDDEGRVVLDNNKIINIGDMYIKELKNEK